MKIKTYYININFKFNEKTLTAEPESIIGGYEDGTGKDYFELLAGDNDLLFIQLVKAIVGEHYYGIRQLLKDDLGINIDNSDIEIIKDIFVSIIE